MGILNPDRKSYAPTYPFTLRPKDQPDADSTPDSSHQYGPNHHRERLSSLFSVGHLFNKWPSKLYNDERNLASRHHCEAEEEGLTAEGEGDGAWSLAYEMGWG